MNSVAVSFGPFDFVSCFEGIIVFSIFSGRGRMENVATVKQCIVMKGAL